MQPGFARNHTGVSHIANSGIVLDCGPSMSLGCPSCRGEQQRDPVPNSLRVQKFRFGGGAVLGGGGGSAA
jgi:hypothetical protein